MWFLYLIYPVGLLSIALAILLTKYFYNIISGSKHIFIENKVIKFKFYIYSIINTTIFTVWLMFCLESSTWQNKVSDYGAPYGIVVLLLLVPVSLVVSYFIKSKEYWPEFYRIFTLSKFLWVLSLLPGTAVVMFYGLLMFSSR